MYDIEVFKYYWVVVIVDDETSTRYVFEDIPSLREFYKENRHQTWVGYNSRNFDAPMIRFIMLGVDPYECSHRLIELKKKWFQFPRHIVEQYKRIPLKNFDTMLPFKGLKKLEGFRGSSIVETSVPFDTDRLLTRKEKDEVVYYCTHDVLETRKVFKDSYKEYQAHEGLIEAFELDPSNFNKTKAQLSAVILGAKKQPHFDEWEFTFPDTLLIEKYKEVMEWYENPANHDYKKKLEIEIAGVLHTFAWGGLHGARVSYSGKGFYLNMDVGSYYPALMIEYNYLSRNVINPEKYREIRDYRLVLKKNKDPRQQPYKIVLNSTFGAMKDKFNDLYDPRQANNVCIGGQLLLLDLIEKVEPYCTLIQSNTDGILVKIEEDENFQYNYDKVMEMSQEWSNRTRMELEYDRFERVYQKDVNNYIMIPDGELYYEDGTPRWKTKGAYVKELSTVDYDLPIVNKAIVNYLVHGTPIDKTVNAAIMLIDFQQICMTSNKYKHAAHGNVWVEKVKDKYGKTVKRTHLNADATIIKDRYLRVFASSNPEDGGIYKVSLKTGLPQKMPNTADHCFIHNSDVTKLLVSDFPQLDREFYINMAKERVINFLSDAPKLDETEPNYTFNWRDA